MNKITELKILKLKHLLCNMECHNDAQAAPPAVRAKIP